jgi:hypothetical protein
MSRGSTGPGFLSLAGSIPSPASNIPVEHGGRATLSYGGGRWFESTRRDHLLAALAKFATKLRDRKPSSCIFADVNVGGLDLALGKAHCRPQRAGRKSGACYSDPNAWQGGMRLTPCDLRSTDLI